MATHYASMQDKIEGEIVRIARNQGESEDVIKFKLEKWNSIPFMPSTELLFMDIEGGTPSRTAEYVQKLLMVNIIEATDIDRSIGVIENADIGLALAASVTTAVPYVDGAQRSSHRTVALHSHKKSVFDPSCFVHDRPAEPDLLVQQGVVRCVHRLESQLRDPFSEPSLGLQIAHPFDPMHGRL